MQTKVAQKYLDKKHKKEENTQAKEQKKLEIKIFQSIQKAVASATADYMQKNRMGFTDLVTRLDVNPFEAAKLQRGNTELILSILTQSFILLSKDPKEIQKNKYPKSIMQQKTAPLLTELFLDSII